MSLCSALKKAVVAGAQHARRRPQCRRRHCGHPLCTTSPGVKASQMRSVPSARYANEESNLVDTMALLNSAAHPTRSPALPSERVASVTSWRLLGTGDGTPLGTQNKRCFSKIRQSEPLSLEQGLPLHGDFLHEYS